MFGGIETDARFNSSVKKKYPLRAGDVRVNVNVDALVLVDVDGFIHEGLEQIHRGLRLGF
jgi:hypothetical protein